LQRSWNKNKNNFSNRHKNKKYYSKG